MKEGYKMKWYEIRQYGETFEAFKAVSDGHGIVTYTRYKVFKTRKAAEGFARTHWVRRWV